MIALATLLTMLAARDRTPSPLLAGVREIPLETTGDLHILAIGIDRYDTLQSLKFAKADATELTAALTRIGRSAHRRVFPRLLLDEEATRAGIEQAFGQLIAAVLPDDTFVFFFAGMGANAPPSATTPSPVDAPARSTPSRHPTPIPREFFLLTSRVTDTVPGTVIKSWLRQIQARKKLVIVDSCYGALFFEDKGAAATIEVGRDTSNATGANILALGSEGMAFESPQLKHGFLTAVLLEALSGKADLSGNGWVDTQELEAFARFRLLQREGEIGRGVELASSRLGARFVIGGTKGTVLPDVRPPRIILDQPNVPPAGEITVPPGTLSLEGRVLDEGGAPELTVNGTAIAIDADGSFKATVESGHRASAIHLVAVDSARNASAKTLWLRGPGSARGPEPVPPTPDRGAVVVPSPSPPGLPKERRRDYALLVATDNYDHWSKLGNPIFDAEAIGAYLQSFYGFQVDLLRNPGRTEFLEAVVRHQGRTFGDDDQLLVFVAGHGFYDERFADGFVVASNSPAAINIANDGQFLQHATLFRMIDRIPCKHILLVLDVCFGGQSLLEAAPVAPLASLRPPASNRARLHGRPPQWPPRVPRPRWLFAAPGVGQGPVQTSAYPAVSDEELLRRKLRGRTRKLLTSGGAEYVPDGRPGHHSPFATRFIDALSSRGGEDGIVTTDEIFSFLERVNPEPRRGLFTAAAPGDFVLVARR